jgi:hypothetical protein
MNASDYLKRSRKIENLIDYVIKEFREERYDGYAPSDRIDIDYIFYNQVMKLINHYKFSANREFSAYFSREENKEEYEILINNKMDELTARLELGLMLKIDKVN